MAGTAPSEVIAGVGLADRPKKSHWPARMDLAQSASGLLLGLFMWGHMFFVSTIPISNDAMWAVTKAFEGYFFFGRAFPQLVSFKGLFCFGQNPAVGGPNSNFARSALDRLEWLVGVDLFENESYGFWKRPGVKPGDIKTEVFLLPAAGSVEKEGSIVNSGRWVQWRCAATKPLGQSKPDTDILTLLARALQTAYAGGGVRPAPIVHLDWDYGPEHADVHAVAKERRSRRRSRCYSAPGATPRPC